jgi:hypothetical protein
LTYRAIRQVRVRSAADKGSSGLGPGIPCPLLDALRAIVEHGRSHVTAGLVADTAGRSVSTMVSYFALGVLTALLVVGFLYVLSRPEGF